MGFIIFGSKSLERPLNRSMLRKVREAPACAQSTHRSKVIPPACSFRSLVLAAVCRAQVHQKNWRCAASLWQPSGFKRAKRSSSVLTFALTNASTFSLCSGTGSSFLLLASPPLLAPRAHCSRFLSQFAIKSPYGARHEALWHRARRIRR